MYYGEGIKVTISREYYGAYETIDGPAWLQDRICKAIPFLNPSRYPYRLVCSDVAGSLPTFGQSAPCNGGYVIDIGRE